MNFDILYLVILTFGVIGTLEWAKAVLVALGGKNWKSVGLAVLSLAVSFGAALAASAGDVAKGLTLTFVLVAMVQLGYQLIVQTMTGLIRRLLAPPGDQAGK